MANIDRTLAALASPMRRRLLGRLGERPRAVGELARGLAVSRPAVSQHLAILKEAGLVGVERRGTARVYYLQDRRLAELRDWLDGFWDRALADFKRVAEKGE